jgi:hypothetical protein
MFKKHPDVGVCHVNACINLWEPNFWNLGAEAIQGYPDKFLARFKKSHPFLDFPNTFTEESLFSLWDNILEELGPVVFDKSPHYLGNKAVFELLAKYMNKGNDVRFFTVIRDPRDAITSQYELWKSYVKDDSPKKRELAWLEKYHHLEYLQDNFADIPLFRYEDFASAPSCYAPMIFKHCGCVVIPETYEHIKPTSLGRYSASVLPSVRAWRFSDKFVTHLKKYGYRIPQLTLFERTSISTRMLKQNTWREIRSVMVRIKNGLTRRST